MKLLSLTLMALAFSSSAFADQIRINCALGDSGRFVSVLKNDGEAAQVKLFSHGQPVVEISGDDVLDLSAGLYRMNTSAAHHNTTLKIASDYQIFGGDVRVGGEEKWNGLLYVSRNLRSETGGRRVVRVQCTYEI